MVFLPFLFCCDVSHSWFSNIDPPLHPRNKSHLIIAIGFFFCCCYVLLDLAWPSQSPCLLVFVLLCNSFQLSVGRTCEVPLTNRIWQKWWDVTPKIIFHYVGFHLSKRHALETLSWAHFGRSNWPCWEAHVQVVEGCLLEAEGSLQPTAHKKPGPYAP